MDKKYVTAVQVGVSFIVGALNFITAQLAIAVAVTMRPLPEDWPYGVQRVLLFVCALAISIPLQWTIAPPLNHLAGRLVDRRASDPD